ncbi:MAG TPA: hypothetical protein VEW07_01340 [Solirubrobacterales bacterium]|nr:hypothetical protein [Solirubrobacterales bacterium]
MTEAAVMPSLSEVTRWVTAKLRDVDGAAAGEVEGFYVDAESRAPVWLIARVGRRRHAKLVALPLRDCAGAAFGVWVAHPGETLSTAPVVDPGRPLRREHELTICGHYGIGESVGRAAEVAGRPEGAVTASPPGA